MRLLFPGTRTVINNTIKIRITKKLQPNALDTKRTKQD